MKETNQKKKFTVPHVYILLLGIIAIFALLSYVLPASVYDMMTVGEREVVDASTWHTVAKTPVTLMQFLSAVPRGLQEVAQIIFFIFIVGGSFAVLQETKALEAGMGKLVKVLKDKAIIIIPVMMVVFSLGGAIVGLAEELIPFIPIFVALCVAMGYDSLTGTAIVLCGAGAGFATAFMNPFTVQVAQGIADLPLLSGMKFRIIMYVCMIILTVAYVIRYALKIKKDPTKSLMYEEDLKREDRVNLDNLRDFTTRDMLILLAFFISVGIVVWGVVTQGWYMDEIAATFFGMSIVCAIIAPNFGFNHYAETLGKGMIDIAVGALVVGFARGILVVMNDANILYTILHGAAALLGHLPSSVSAVGMYIFQCLLNWIVPSGSGQAAISMPIMAPLADLVGVTRQTAVIAFQLGDGISNIFTPTSGYFMAGLALAKVPWEKWAKWFAPLMGLQYLLGLIFVIAAQVLQLGPF